MATIGKNWTCPYCGHAQVISAERYDFDWHALSVKSWAEGLAACSVKAIVCANAECMKMSVDFSVAKRTDWQGGEFKIKSPFHSWRLLPLSFAKPQPDFIPEALRRDYEEACAIRDLSPKASATLTRRCIQGIIRDFCGINTKDNRLISEIKELRKQIDEGRAPAGVQSDTVDAIDDVRQIGNIGAHMEADINVIVDVDPGEAQILIELTELLFEEWYAERDKRTKKIKKLHEISEAKKSAK